MKWWTGVVLVGWMGLTACADADLETEAVPANVSAGELRLYVFDCGRIQLETVEGFGIEDHETDVREFAAPCYMVEHPEGRLLWDGGLPSEFAEEEGWVTRNGGSPIRLDRSLEDQLADLDLDMGSFDYVAFSHMHYDHVGIANEVRDATLIMQRPEFEAAFPEDGTESVFPQEVYEGLYDLDRLIVNGDIDLFGDGRVQVISAPGHTPGHQVLFVDLVETGPVVLSGDLYHFRLSREDRRVPDFNVDTEQTLQSMDRVEALVERTDAWFWMQHEAAHFDTLTLAPGHYR